MSSFWGVFFIYIKKSFLCNITYIERRYAFELNLKRKLFLTFCKTKHAERTFNELAVRQCFILI